MMNKTNIFYFSGTGNCLASSKQIAEGLDGAEIIAITDELIQKKDCFESEVCILVYPSYAYGLPKNVKKFIKYITIKTDYLALLVTFGTSPGGSNAAAVRQFKRKNQKVDFCFGAGSVENYSNIFGLAKEEKIKLRTEIQLSKTEEFIKLVNEKHTNKINTFRPLSVLVSLLFNTFKPLLTKMYRVKDTCNGCELCRRICPADAITMVEKNQKKKPKFDARKCDHCQGCLHLCPQKAIKFMRITPKARRYKHCKIKSGELIKRD